MIPQNQNLFHKGNFSTIDRTRNSEGIEALRHLMEWQNKYDKKDSDTALNEIRDETVALMLGFDEINESKHGFDARRKSIHPEFDYEYLEVKAANYSSKKYHAVFNDTSLEKAESFRNESVFIAMPIWLDAVNILCIVFGASTKIGDFLKEKVLSFKDNKSMRCTQSIDIRKLIYDYDFRIFTMDKDISITYNLLAVKYPKKPIEKKYFTYFDVSGEAALCQKKKL